MEDRKIWRHFCWCVKNTKARKNTIHLLCSLAFSVLCWFFVCWIFMWNPKPENPDFFLWNAPRMTHQKLPPYGKIYICFQTDRRYAQATQCAESRALSKYLESIFQLNYFKRNMQSSKFYCSQINLKNIWSPLE